MNAYNLPYATERRRQLLNQSMIKVTNKMTLIENIGENNEFYIGVTAAKNKAKREQLTLHETTDIEEARLMSSIIVHKLIFHENEKIRKNLLNQRGGGQVIEASTVGSKYVIYISIKSKAETGFDKKFQDGNFFAQEIEALVKKMIEIKLTEIYLDKGRKIKIGFSRDLNNRMPRYESLCYDLPNRTQNENHETWILLQTGVLYNGNVLNFHDIRKCEVMFISQLTFLDYQKYYNLLLNDGGGGDVGLSKDEEKNEAYIYFRAFSFIETYCQCTDSSHKIHYVRSDGK